MIYRFTFLLVFACYAAEAFAQPGNLVENPSFEYRSECDDNNGPLSEAPPWYSPTGATPDVFHECAIVLEEPCPYPETVNLDPWFFGVPTNTVGCQEPRTGVGNAGLLFYSPNVSGMDHREYLGMPLSETLIAGETYLVRFFVSLSERSQYSVHAIQVLFTSNEISEPSGFWGVLNYAPQLSHTSGDFITDKENWTELSWQYTADGTEQYMYLGNFQSNAEIDTLFVLPDSLSTLFHYHGAYYYLDDVYVGSEALSLSEKEPFVFDMWPNPVDEILMIQTHAPLQSLVIYSIFGSVLYQHSGSWSTKIVIDVSSLPAGVYVISARNLHGNLANQKIVKR